MADASIIFDLIGRDRASGDFDRVGNAADRTGGKMIKLGKLVAGLGLGAAFYKAGTALIGMAKGAAEDAAGQARLAKALHNATGATKAQVAGVEDWITKQGKALGVADDQLRPALEKLAVATGDVGKAQKLASLGMDVAAGTGLSLEQVSKALAKAQNGQVAGLSKLGISTKDAAGHTITFEEAQKRLAAAHGGQAATAAGTLEGKIGRLKLALSEAGESIGAKLLPVATDLTNWAINEGLPKMEAFGSYLGEVLPPIFDKVKSVVSTVMGALRGDIGGNLDGIKGIFTDAISIVQSLWNAFGSNILTFLQGTFENIKTVISGAFTVIQGIFQTVSALLKGDWSGVWEGIKQILSGAVEILKGLVSQLWNSIKFAFSNGVVIVKGVFSGLWDGIKNLAASGASWLVEKIKGIPGSLKDAAGNYLEAGKTLIGKFWDGIKAAAGNAGGFVSDLLGKIKSGINNVLHLPLEINFDKGPIHIHATLIPAFARGTNFAPGGMSLVGEEGPEIVNLRRGSTVTPAGQTARMLGGGSNTVVNVNISGALDPLAVGRQLEQVLIQYTRATGRPLQVATS